ncbi:MAG TPA: cytochrome c family protein [Ignavibacteriaceae bacterium]|nr:cytochrome c family protein [Ignavibacteriaceae bacterium]
MLKKITLALVFFLTPMLLAQGKMHEFVGAKTCGMCHKSEKQGEQLPTWEKSAHAKAYETLKTAEADKIAKDKGFTTKAVETEACLKCHVSGYGVDASLLGKKFNMEDGVQCETCHGAGGDYKSLKIMKDQKVAVENGLMVFNTKEERVALCQKCHNSDSPTFDAAKTNFDEMWTKIAHDIPGEK